MEDYATGGELRSHRTIALLDCLIAALLEHRVNQNKIRQLFGLIIRSSIW